MNVNGVVLREITLKEEDKIVVVFSKEYGKISLYAREAKKIKSPFLAGTQLLTYSNFYVHKKDNLSTIKRIEIKDSYVNLKNDIKKLYLAMYFLELTESLIIEENPVKDMFNFFILSLGKLKNGKNLKLMKCIFELKMLALAGYMPNVMTCQKCNKTIINEAFFYKEKQGLVCNECIDIKKGIKLSETTIYTLKYILHENIQKIYKFNIDEEYEKELIDVCNKYKEHILEKKLKTEEFFLNIIE